VHQVLALNQPTFPRFDVQCPLISLPRLFDTTLDTIPAAVPYLHPDPALKEEWGKRFDGHEASLKVGLCWAGAARPDPKRSMPLSLLAPLAQVRNVRFFSLQKGDAAAQAAAPPQGLTLTDWTDDLHDFADTAALVAHLDLIVTVDTSVAHLAGAIAKPVWVLLRRLPAWTYMLDRSDNPWYPTMRVFRQKHQDDWTDPIAQLVQALQNPAGK